MHRHVQHVWITYVDLLNSVWMNIRLRSLLCLCPLAAGFPLRPLNSQMLILTFNNAPPNKIKKNQTSAIPLQLFVEMVKMINCGDHSSLKGHSYVVMIKRLVPF